jgi:hypothetical protein
MDRNSFFWQIQDGKLPQPAAARTLGMNILRVDPGSGHARQRLIRNFG